MTKAKAQAAIDEAFADGIKHIFGVLVQNLMDADRKDGVSKFISGLSFHDEAYSKASAAIETIFPE